MSSNPSTNGTIIRRLVLRAVCPLVVYAWLFYAAAAAHNLKALVCLAGLPGLLFAAFWTIRRVQHAAEASATPANRDEHLRLQLLLGKRLGGCFCGIVLGVGLCFLRCTPSRFLMIAVPVLLSGAAAICFLGLQTERKLRSASKA